MTAFWPLIRLLTGLLGLLLAGVFGMPASTSAATPTYSYDTYDAPVRLSPPGTVATGAWGSVSGPRVAPRVSPVTIRDRAVAANTARAGAHDVLNGVRLRAQLTGEEISGGHAFQKHVIDQSEFPGITTRPQFASHIEEVVLNGETRTLGGGRTAYRSNGTVVIRNPNAVDGGTAFRPTSGYDYFLNLN
jgi:hypothetical protein